MAVKFRTTQACPNSWYMRVDILDSDGRRTGDWGNEARYSAVAIDDTLTVEVRIEDPDVVDSFEYEWNCR